MVRDGDSEDPIEAVIRGALVRERSAGGDDCPPPAMLAAYYDGALDAEERARWEQHTAACARCQGAIAAFVRIGGTPLALDASASGLPHSNRTHQWIRRVPIAIAGFAAAAAIAIVIVMHTRPHGSPHEVASGSAGTQVAPDSAQLALNEMKALSAPQATPAPPAAQPLGAIAHHQLRNGAQHKSARPMTRARNDKDLRQHESVREELQDGELQTMAKDLTSPAPAPTMPLSVERRESAIAVSAATAPEVPMPAPPPAPPPAAAPTARAAASSAAATAGQALGAGTGAIIGSAAGQPGFTRMAQNRAAVQGALPGANAIIVEPPDASVVWMIGSHGALSRYGAGRTWIPQASGVSSDLIAGSAPSATTCWIVGRSGTIIRTTDGEHWMKISAPANRDFNAVVAQNADAVTIFAGASRWTTTDGGVTWRQP